MDLPLGFFIALRDLKILIFQKNGSSFGFSMFSNWEKFLEPKRSCLRQFLVLRLFYLTLSWPGRFWIHPKIGCLNFKPQYLLNYSSPTNDLYSVRKRSIRAFKSLPHWLRTLRQNFARPAFLTAFQQVSKHARAALTQCWYQWDKRATNENWKNWKSALIFLIFWCQFLDFGDVVNIPWKGAECYAMSENLIQEFSLPYNQLVCLEFAETKCAEFVTVAKLGLMV